MLVTCASDDLIKHFTLVTPLLTKHFIMNWGNPAPNNLKHLISATFLFFCFYDCHFNKLFYNSITDHSLMCVSLQQCVFCRLCNLIVRCTRKANSTIRFLPPQPQTECTDSMWHRPHSNTAVSLHLQMIPKP